MRAVLVIELDLPDDAPHHALPDAAAALGRPPHAVGLHAAIREDADRVLAVFEKEQP